MHIDDFTTKAKNEENINPIAIGNSSQKNESIQNSNNNSYSACDDHCSCVGDYYDD